MRNPFKKLGQPQPTRGADYSDNSQLSHGDYEQLVRAVAARAEQQASWDQIQTYLRNRNLTPGQIAQWMAKYGGRWVNSPDPVFGQRLICLSLTAQGDLASIAAVLGQAMVSPSPATAPPVDQSPLGDAYIPPPRASGISALSLDFSPGHPDEIAVAATPVDTIPDQPGATEIGEEPLDSGPDQPGATEIGKEPLDSGPDQPDEIAVEADPVAEQSPSSVPNEPPEPGGEVEPASHDLGDSDQWAIPGRSYRLQGSIFIEEDALPFVAVDESQPRRPTPLGLLWPSINQAPGNQRNSTPADQTQGKPTESHSPDSEEKP